MGNWKARGVGEMIVTVGCEVVTGDTSSSGGRQAGKVSLITSTTEDRLTVRGVGVACTVGRHDVRWGGETYREVWVRGGAGAYT